MVHDCKTAYLRIENKRPSNNMVPFGEKVGWMMPKDSHRSNKLESTHPCGVSQVSCQEQENSWF